MPALGNTAVITQCKLVYIAPGNTAFIYLYLVSDLPPGDGMFPGPSPTLYITLQLHHCCYEDIRGKLLLQRSTEHRVLNARKK